MEVTSTLVVYTMAYYFSARMKEKQRIVKYFSSLWAEKIETKQEGPFYKQQKN